MLALVSSSTSCCALLAELTAPAATVAADAASRAISWIVVVMSVIAPERGLGIGAHLLSALGKHLHVGVGTGGEAIH